MPDADPRDEVVCIHRALTGLAMALSHADEPLDNSLLSALLFLLVDRLGPAADELQHYAPRA